MTISTRVMLSHAESEFGRQGAFAAAERVSGDADRGTRTERDGHRECIRHFVQFAGEDAGLKPHPRASGIDLEAFHRRQIDHHAAVAGAMARETMASAAHRDEEIAIAREFDGMHDVFGGPAHRAMSAGR